MPLRAPIQGRPGAPPAGQTPSQGIWELHRSMPRPGENVPRPYGCEIEGGTQLQLEQWFDAGLGGSKGAKKSERGDPRAESPCVAESTRS